MSEERSVTIEERPAKKGKGLSPEAAASEEKFSRRKTIPWNCGSNWTDNELRFFDIHVVREDSFEAFFKEKPSQLFDHEVLEFLDLDLEAVRPKTSLVGSGQVRHLAKDLIGVTKSHRNEESVVYEMSKSLLQLFQYDSGEKAVRTRCVLALEMSDHKTEATPGVYVEDEDSSIKLLVQEDKSWYVGNDRNLKGHHPVAQLIAEVIAAYQENVNTCDRLVLPAYPKERIVMLGTRPAFYLIHMTSALSECVKRGQPPQAPTIVQEYVPPNLPVTISDAMLEKRLRRHVAQCLRSFKLYLD